MSLKRIMPCLLLQDKRLVKTVNFKNPAYIGDPINAVKIYNDKEVDELVLLDISATNENKNIDFDLLKDFASECFMPLAYGGGVRTVDDFQKLYALGIEKVVVNTLLIDHPMVVKEAANKFGNQSVVASIDIVRESNDNFKIFSHAKRAINMNFKEYLDYVLKLNVGELFITSVDNEGTWKGYDNELISHINNLVDIPVIANGGCGTNEDLKSVLYETGVQAAAIGSMAVYQKKDMGVLIRFPKRNQIIIDEQSF
jgi:imidazole glycerol-phosphate synthase subunit HisF